ncbi:RagB/SusD family nutrient uptake outer membrane protein [Chitinophaga sp. 22620]|uniref:RagB/SusD family nutrient uptake outer membrane protein n=1 Tax=Chitinophaga sp. 22620 TaxID=3453952 RepID=UPI003F871CA8
MKKIQTYILFGLVTAGVYTACKPKDLLEKTETTTLNEQVVFSDSVRTLNFVTAIYSDVGLYNFQKRWGNGGSLAECADEGTSRLFGGTQPYVVVALSTTSANSTGPYINVYDGGWKNIRRVNTFLKNIGKTPMAEEMKTQLKGEVRFLRAWYYWQMLQYFGGLPLIKDSIYSNTDYITQPRASYEDCVNYLVSELDDAAGMLAATPDQQEQDYGRANKGMCMALKARILLYAASPLINSKPQYNTVSLNPAVEKAISYGNYDPARWQRALDACNDVINSGWYSLVEDNSNASRPGDGFYKLFITRFNSEYIFPAMFAANRQIEQNYLPDSRDGNVNSSPTYNHSKRFGTITGKPIATAPLSEYDPAKPFEGRDPRFGYTYLYNGALWRTTGSSTRTPVWTHVGAPTDGFDVSLVYTGMFCRKFCHESATGSNGTNPDRVMPLIRYGDILLMAAECLIELNRVEEGIDHIIAIRKRAGIKPGGDGRYGIPAGISQDDARALLRNERAVELSFEDSRFWDVRRWKTAITELNATMTRIRITKQPDGKFTYEEVPLNKNPVHYFFEQNYFFPFPVAEVMKNPNLIQNPGY